MSAVSRLKQRLIGLLRWSERYTKTDMVYLASGTFWSNVNAAVVAGLAFLGSIMFARFLSKDAYGTYQYILSISGLLTGLTLTGMNSAVTRAVARGHEGELKHAVRFQVIAGAIPLIAGVCVALWYFFHGNTGLGLAFAGVAIFMPLGSAYNTWAAYTGGKKLFRVGTYYGLANNIVSYGSILLAIFYSRNFLWIVFANFFFTFLSNFIIYHLVVKNIPPNNERDNETISYGTHLSLMGILGAIAGQLDALLVFHFIGAAALAVYSFATIIPERLSGILKFIPNLMLPKLAPKDENHVRDFIWKRLWIFLLFIAAVAGAYALVAPWLFHTFFPQYAASIPFTQIYSLSFFSLAVLIVQTVLTSLRKTKELYIYSFGQPIIKSILMVTLLYYYGIWGLLWAQMIVNFLSLIFQLILLGRKPAQERVQTA